MLRGVDVRLLGRLLDQQKQAGRAAVQLVEGATVGAPAAKGADEPGKGSQVDVVA